MVGKIFRHIGIKDDNICPFRKAFGVLSMHATAEIIFLRHIGIITHFLYYLKIISILPLQ